MQIRSLVYDIAHAIETKGLIELFHFVQNMLLEQDESEQLLTNECSTLYSIHWSELVSF